MKSVFSLSKIITGFIAGVMFIASCGGDNVNKAHAFNVQSQLFCERITTGSVFLLNNAFQGEVSAVPKSLSCIDSSGNTYHETNLEDVYSFGWKVQLISGNNEYVFFM
jgi:hypothetical protein